MTNAIDGKDVYEYKVQTGATWDQTAERFNLSRGAARKRARQYYNEQGLPPPQEARVIGGMDEEPRPDGAELWQRAIGIQRRREQTRQIKESRRVIYEDGPVVLMCMADLHLGGAGVNYLAVDEDIRLIHQLSQQGVNVAVLLIGDLLDGYIVGRLKDLRMTSSPFLTIEEWGLVDYALSRLAPHIIGSVAGNHDLWSYSVVGVDLLRERHRQLTPGILYDPYELGFILQVGEFETRVMARHSWKGNSLYNPTHGLEQHHLTRGREFDIGIGAHTHKGALAREFDNGGRVGYAIICGSYKEDDEYGSKLGLPPALPTSAVAVVIDTDGVQFATSNLYALPRLLGSD